MQIASTSTGQSWALTNYCPAPGPVPAAPSNRDYAPGFMAALMLKDMKLSQAAAEADRRRRRRSRRTRCRSTRRWSMPATAPRIFPWYSAGWPTKADGEADVHLSRLRERSRAKRPGESRPRTALTRRRAARDLSRGGRGDSRHGATSRRRSHHGSGCVQGGARLPVRQPHRLRRRPRRLPLAGAGELQLRAGLVRRRTGARRQRQPPGAEDRRRRRRDARPSPNCRPARTASPTACARWASSAASASC